MSASMDFSTSATAMSQRSSSAWPSAVSRMLMMRPWLGSGSRAIQPRPSIILTISLADWGEVSERSASCALESCPCVLRNDSVVYCGTVSPSGSRLSRIRRLST